MRLRKKKNLVWVFDMDGTLYSGVEHVWSETVKEMLRYFKETLGLPVDLSQEEQDRLRKKWQTRQTTVSYVCEYGLNFNEVIEATHLPILEHLRVEARTGINSIPHLPGKKIVLTNSPEAFAHGLLHKLGIHHYFDEILGLRHDVFAAKPHIQSYKRITAGARTFMIEDWEENLIVPHQLGWTTAWFPEEDQSHHSPLPTHVHKHITSLEELHLLV